MLDVHLLRHDLQRSMRYEELNRNKCEWRLLKMMKTGKAQQHYTPKSRLHSFYDIKWTKSATSSLAFMMIWGE